MAKAKKSTASSRKLPAGFKAISSFGDNWSGEKFGDSITGKITKIETVSFPAQGKKGSASYRPARDVPKYHVETKDGTRAVLVSAGLRALEQTKKGQTVYIEYVGKRKIKAGQNPMREYVVAVK